MSKTKMSTKKKKKKKSGSNITGLGKLGKLHGLVTYKPFK